MRVEDFPRPKGDNRRGIHWSASVYHPAGSAVDFWIDELRALNIKWVKLLDDGGGSSLELCKRLLAADIMPVVRLYRLGPNPGHIGGREADTIKRQIDAGVRYFETNNEPDLPAEWKDGHMLPDWLDVVVDNFIIDADSIIGMGGLPAFPAMGVGAKDNYIQAVVQKGRADLFEKGAWVAIHNYTLNHPLDYPYDSVNQEGTPVSQEEYDRLGGWAWENRPRELINQWRASDKNPGATLESDASCFLAFHLLNQQMMQALGHTAPIISTEGGPVVGWKDDRRYPRIGPRLHSDMAVAINDFMQGGREIYGLQCPNNYFAVCHWLIGNYKLGFMAPGWESQSWYTDWWNSDFSLHGEMPVVADVKAMPNRVVDEANQAVVAGLVLRSDNDGALADLTVKLLTGDREVASTVTGADGAFRFERLVPGVYDLAVPPWGVVRRGVTAALALGPSVVIRLTGGASSTLTGTVLTAAGAPQTGVQVTLMREGVQVAETQTAADGTFRFSGLPLGAYQLTVPGIILAGLALDGWQTKNLRLTAGAATSSRYVVTKQRLLDAAETGNRRVFYGVVTDAAGKPLNGVKVQMSWHGADPGTAFPVVTTGSDPYRPAGSYEFTHTPGLFILRIVQGDWPSDLADNLDTAQVAGRAGQPITYEVNFQLQPVGTPAQVDGVVTGGQAGRVVRLVGASGTRETQLAADGSFVFPNLPAGSYRLELAGIGVIAETVTLAPGTLFKQLFPLRGSVAGKVIAPPDGMIAVLYAPQAWGWTRQALLDADGRFSFEGLPAGRYRVEVGTAVFSDLICTGENGLQLAAIDLAAGQRSAIRGRVADGAGQPKPDIVVTLRRDGLEAGRTRTAADGSYQFTGLTAGVYSLDVTGMGIVASNIVLDGEREHRADVLWVAPGPRSALQGRLLSATGASIPGATLRLLRDGAEVARTQTDSSGAFWFTGLPGGVYALAVGDEEPVLRDIVVDEDMTVTRDVVLPAAPRRVAQYVLLPALQGEAPDVEARLILALAANYAIRSGATVGFSAGDAACAARVILAGDAIPAELDGKLAAAGCQVTRLAGAGFTLAEALSRLTQAAAAAGLAKEG